MQQTKKVLSRKCELPAKKELTTENQFNAKDFTAQSRTASENKLAKGLMTDGIIYKQLLFFSLPLILGNLFQQLYNIVDSIIVGNFIGGNALAAVGAGSAVINLLIGLLVGLTTGAGVVVSQFFGAGDPQKVKQSVHTAFAFTLIFGLIISLVGIFVSDYILIWTNTPPQVFDQASVYLKIFFSGLIFLTIYNMGAGILRAVGDSKTPLYYLGVACFVNIVLDILFVVVIGMGVEGVAIATLIAQAAAALLTVHKLMISSQSCRLILKEISIYGPRLRQILYIGIPSGMQQMIISLSNVIIQGYINGFGADAMAGWSAYSKLDGILLLPIFSFGLAMTTFTGQNIGAAKLDRIRQGAKSCLYMSCGFSLAASLIMYLYGGYVFRIFTSETNVLQHAVYMMKGLIPFYFLLAVIQVYSGVISGAGRSFASMIIMVINMCVIRIILLWFIAPLFPDVRSIFYAYIISWLGCAVCMVLYYLKGSWKNTSLQPGI